MLRGASPSAWHLSLIGESAAYSEERFLGLLNVGGRPAEKLNCA